MRRATRSDVAARAGVAPTTVSIVMNGRSDEVRIAEATRQRVLEAARELNYVPQASARALRGTSSKVIGLLLGPLPDDGHVSVVQVVLTEALRQAERAGYWVLPFSTSSEPTEAADRIREVLGSVDLAGLVCEGVMHEEIVATLIERLALPASWLGFSRGDEALPGVAHIETDNEAGYLDLLSQIDCDWFDRVVILDAPGHEESRFAPVIERFGDKVSTIMASGWEPGDAIAVSHDLVRSTDKVIVFAASDTLARGLLLSARDANRELGDELSVVGFGNEDPGLLDTLGITTVDWPLRRLTERCFSALVDSIAGRDVTSPHEVIPSRAVIRSSVRLRPE